MIRVTESISDTEARILDLYGQVVQIMGHCSNEEFEHKMRLIHILQFKVYCYEENIKKRQASSADGTLY